MSNIYIWCVLNFMHCKYKNISIIQNSVYFSILPLLPIRKEYFHNNIQIELSLIHINISKQINKILLLYKIKIICKIISIFQHLRKEF